jgi:hypothetical protein
MPFFSSLDSDYCLLLGACLFSWIITDKGSRSHKIPGEKVTKL